MHSTRLPFVSSRCRNTAQVGPGCQNLRLRKRSLAHATGLTCVAAAIAPPQTSFVLHVDQTSISFPLRPENGKGLDDALQSLLQTFAAKQKAERPQRWKSMEFRVKGEADQPGMEYFEVFCNPNSAANAFTAKALITVQTRDGVKVTTEGSLSALKEDLDSFLQQQSL